MKTIEKYTAGTYRNNGDFKSFVPSMLNDDWQWTDRKLNHLLAEASKELGRLNAYSELVPDIDTYIRMHIRVEANKSSRIEGTNTTIEEDMMRSEDLDPEHRDDVQEVNNYIDAMNHGIDRIQQDDFPFTTRLLREMHAILLRGVRGEHKTPGEFRTSQNFIGGTRPGNAVYVPPAVVDMNDLLGDFDKFMNREDDMPVLVKLAMLHYQIESIHPFLDGNGRIGRLTIPLYLLARKELDKPCFYISGYFEQHRTEYYDALQNVRLKNDMLGWICFFLKASIETARDAVNKFTKAVNLVQENRDYMLTKHNNSDSINKVIQALYKKPVATVADLVEASGLSSPTVRNMVNILLQDGMVDEITGNRRNRIYCFTRYVNVFR